MGHSAVLLVAVPPDVSWLLEGDYNNEKGPSVTRNTDDYDDYDSYGSHEVPHCVVPIVDLSSLSVVGVAIRMDVNKKGLLIFLTERVFYSIMLLRVTFGRPSELLGVIILVLLLFSSAWKQ